MLVIYTATTVEQATLELLTSDVSMTIGSLSKTRCVMAMAMLLCV